VFHAKKEKSNAHLASRKHAGQAPTQKLMLQFAREQIFANTRTDYFKFVDYKKIN